MSFLLDTPQQLFRDSRGRGKYQENASDGRRDMFNSMSSRNRSFSMRSNSKRKPIFGSSSRKRNQNSVHNAAFKS